MDMTPAPQTNVSLIADILSRLTLPIIASRKTYQPVYLNGRLISKGGRESYDRWAQIEKLIDVHKIKSVTDIGCAEGFFIRKAVEKGCFAAGIDTDMRKLLWAQTTLTLDRLENFSFTKMHITTENIHHIPRADMVIFLSVHHHIMTSRGQEYAFEIIKKIKTMTGQVLIFEMGQSNEGHYSWSKQLPDMGASPRQWIAEYLKSAGFSDVQELCHVKSHKSPVSRVTLAAYV